MEKKYEDHEKVQNELGLILTHVEGVSSWMLYTHTHTHKHQWEVSINSDHLLPDYFPPRDMRPFPVFPYLDLG